MVKVLDMHCDTISRIHSARLKGANPGLASNEFHLDLQKMKAGGYGLQNFALFTDLDAASQQGEPPFEAVIRQMDTFFAQMHQNKQHIQLVTDYQQIEKNWQQDRLSALLTIEEGGVCQGDPAFLRTFYALGVRMMTLTWNHQNQLGWPNRARAVGDGAWEFTPETDRGLTKTGIEFVHEMERMGMIIDISHLGDKGIWDVFAQTKEPFVASHSNCRSIANHPRNLTDEMIKALARRGGVTGINFCADFLAPRKHGYTWHPDQRVKSLIGDIILHIRHLKQVGGIEVIGLGSDFDGITGALELPDGSHVQLLAQAMEAAGFCIGEIEAVFHKNVLRVYRERLNDKR